MTLRTSLITSALLIAAGVALAPMASFAATAPAAPAQVCKASAGSDASFLNGYAAIKVDAKKSSAVKSFLRTNPNKAVCLIVHAKALDPELAKDLLTRILALLGADKKNAALVTKLTDDNADLLAPAKPVEPGAGQDPAGQQDFGGNDAGNPEQPSQLNGGGNAKANSQSRI